MPSEAHHRVEGSAEPHMKTILIEFDHVWDVLGIFFFESSGLVRTIYIYIYTSLVKREALDPRSFVETEISISWTVKRWQK